MTITVSVPDGLAEQAAIHGLTVEAFVEWLVHQAAQGEPTTKRRRRTPAEAVSHLREAREGVKLDGLKIKDLISEGRKY